MTLEAYGADTEYLQAIRFFFQYIEHIDFCATLWLWRSLVERPLNTV